MLSRFGSLTITSGLEVLVTFVLWCLMLVLLMGILFLGNWGWDARSASGDVA